ncbi:MAG: polysaccharide export protein [Gemmatimonadales bacterium]|nr:polysaccharide export protein [Gemmatimonadales bacterium]
MFRDKLSSIASLLAWLALLALAGCGGSEFVSRNNFVKFSPEQKEQLRLQNDQSYRIQEGDILKVAFFYLNELTQDNVIVLPDGSVSLEGIDRAELAGLTVLEADALLTAAYSYEYRNPNLSVIVRETRGKRIYVTGEVGNPGLYEVPPKGLGLMNAITLANGFTDDAARDGVVLIRVTPEGYLCQEVNLSEFYTVKAGDLGPLELEGFDIIYVPRSRSGDFAYFSRAILSGAANIMGIVADFRYIKTGQRY